MQIMLTGMHRSGTSAFGRMLDILGIYCGQPGDLMDANPDNPKGFMERTDVVHLNDDVLRACDARWNQVTAYRVPPSAEKARLLAERARDIVREMDARRPWFIKDPRFCLTFPIWRPLLERPLCLITVRNPLQVARSLLHRADADPISGMALWEYYMVSALRKTSGLPRLLIHYDQMIGDPYAYALGLRDRLGAVGVSGIRDPDRSEVRRWISADLHRHRESREDFESQATESQVALYQALIDGSALNGASWLPSEQSMTRLQEYEYCMSRRDRIMDEMRDELDHRGRLIRDLKQQCDRRDERLERIAHHLSSLRESWSWRLGRMVTAPWRMLAWRTRARNPADAIREELREAQRDRNDVDSTRAD